MNYSIINTSAFTSAPSSVGCTAETNRRNTRRVIKDPGSSLTHFAGLVGALLGTVPLIQKAAMVSDWKGIFATAVFISSMILLYGASTAYHTFDVSLSINRILKKIDHMMISVLIAGSYTPVCVILLKVKGTFVLVTVWALAITGILIKAFWIYCPKWFSSVLYIGMGWTCLLAMPAIIAALTPEGFSWLLAGGILYTVGGIIYACKFSDFNAKHPCFGSHEIFHLFVMGGSLCHYIFMYGYVL